MRFAAILLSWLVCSTASATEREIVPVEKGQPAPFSGMLFPNERALRLGMKLERCEELRVAEKSRLELRYEIKLGAVMKQAVIDLDAERAKSEVYRKASEPMIWEHPIFVATVTAVLTYGILRLAKELP